jgi:hypothetical protein
MMITTKTTISFSIPDEYILAQRFAVQHPDWIEVTASTYIGYTRQDTYAIDLKEEGKEE